MKQILAYFLPELRLIWKREIRCMQCFSEDCINKEAKRIGTGECWQVWCFVWLDFKCMHHGALIWLYRENSQEHDENDNSENKGQVNMMSQRAVAGISSFSSQMVQFHSSGEGSFLLITSISFIDISNLKISILFRMWGNEFSTALEN